jgi:hypothetical protein
MGGQHGGFGVEWGMGERAIHFGFWILDFGWRNGCWDGISAIDLPNLPFNMGILFGGDRPLIIPAIAATSYHFIVFGTEGFMRSNHPVSIS